MAINGSTDRPKMLNTGYAQSGAICWITNWALALAGLVAYAMNWGPLAQASPPPTAILAMQVLGALVAIILALACGVFLLKGRVWAQPVLLTWACVIMVVWVSVFFKVVIEWSTGAGHAVPPPIFLAAIAIGLVLPIAVVVLLWAGAAPNSRLRYASNVIITGGLALILFVVVNLIAQSPGSSYKKDVQWFGQYGLSERSRKILAAVHERVQITSLYSTSEANAASPERAARVWDLLSEVHDVNSRIDVSRATTDADRAAILARIAQQSRQRAPAYVGLVNSFLTQDPNLLMELRSQENQWRQLPAESYLNLWGAAGQVSDMLKSLLQDHEDLMARLSKSLKGLPDYAKLSDDVKTLCAGSRKDLGVIDENLKMLAKIAPAVAANRAATAAKLDAVAASLRQASRALAASSSTQSSQPADPGDLLKAFMALVQDASDKAAVAAQSLDEVAGPENARFIRGSRAWLIGGDDSLTIDDSGAVRRYDLSTAFRDVSNGLLQQKMIAQSVVQTMTKEYQTKVLSDLRTTMTRIITGMDSLVKEAKTALDRLATVDPPTADILKQVAEGKYLQGPIALLAGLMDLADKLPTLSPGTLASDVTEENTVLIETADKTEAVRFNDVWPVRTRPPGPAGPEPAEQRVFNGDSAICSKVLTMTQKPCATVILAYMPVPPQMAQAGAEPGMTPQVLEEMAERLRQANFRVKAWDLSASDAPMGVDEPNEPALPKVLMVLPPPDLPMMMAGEGAAFGPEFIKRLRREIDSGDVAGAIFLAEFQPPPRMPSPYAPSGRYGWNDYLKSDWGIEAKTNYLLVPAERDETGQRFQLSASRLQYLPLSTFSDHPIGRPLQGQRAFWSLPVPVVTGDANQRPPGVTVEPLLTVPSYWTSTWATGDFSRIIAQFQETGSYVSPDFEQGDMKPPFDVAVAARREGDAARGVSPARVVVLGMGGSFVDNYIQRPVITLQKNAISSEDPPKGDLDVLVNSAYWVCARDEYIASGPVQVQPIRKIGENTYRVLWTLCVVGLPAVLLCLGGLVLLLRRR